MVLFWEMHERKSSDVMLLILVLTVLYVTKERKQENIGKRKWLETIKVKLNMFLGTKYYSTKMLCRLVFCNIRCVGTQQIGIEKIFLRTSFLFKKKT